MADLNLSKNPTRLMTVSTPRVGVIGGGQLARMMQPAAINLGIHLRVLSATATDSAAQVIPDTVVAHDLFNL